MTDGPLHWKTIWLPIAAGFLVFGEWDSGRMTPNAAILGIIVGLIGMGFLGVLQEIQQSAEDIESRQEELRQQERSD